MVTLCGTIVKEIDARLCFRVEPELGDAPRYGLAGDIWIARHQCLEVIEAASHAERDVIRIPDNVARAKRRATAPPAQQGRR